MSRDTLPQFFAFPQADRAAPPVSVPFGVNFQGTKCAWGILRDRLVHVADAEVDKTTVRLRALDAWQVRADFLAVDSREEMLSFLNRTGVFWKHTETFSWQQIEAFQQGIRHMVKTLPNKWKNTSFANEIVPFAIMSVCRLQVRFHWTPKTHAAMTEAETTLRAIVTTVLLDKLRGAKFDFCTVCHHQYQIKSRHARKYCGLACAHRMAVQMSRDRKRKRPNVQFQAKTDRS